MNLFKSTTWKWWELKFIASGGMLFGLALGAQFSEALTSWINLFFIGFVLLWLYVMIAWFKK